MVLAVLLAATGWSVPAASAQQPPPPRVDLGAYAERLRFGSADGAILEVPGHGRYIEDLDVLLGPDGDMTLVNDVSMTHYVEGLDEVPVDWPMEALKAQAVAARTYAWYVIFNQNHPGYDICATVACQVFHGREPVEDPQGERWVQAVAETEGQVLTYAGEPILARYFSTSGGHTRNNEDVFPSEGAYPYLKGVPDPEDAVSPLHEWQVRFPRDRMDEILSRGETLSQAVPLADIRLVPGGGGRTDQVRLTSQDGRQVTLPASRFRAFVSDAASDLWPDDYPSQRSDGRRLPLTLPSSRMSFQVTADEVVVDGRGYGHGVGMSQYGAKGKADAGVGYADILASYYQGLRPEASPAVPDRVRVGVETDGEIFEIRSEQPFRVIAGDRVITERGLGPWQVLLGSDRTMRLSAPEGYGAPLVVSPTSTGQPEPTELAVIELEAVVNKPSELYLTVTGADGEVLRRRIGIVESGRHSTTWDLDAADGEQLQPGGYRVALEAVDEDGERAGSPQELTIRAVPAPEGELPPLLRDVPSPAGSDLPLLVLGAVLGAVVGAGVGGLRGQEGR